MTVYFSPDHEWLKVEGDVAMVGITDHAATQLGDIAYVEINDVGTQFARGDEIGVIESVKAASELYGPVSGEVVEINDATVAEPALVNESPQGRGWLCRIKMSDPAELDQLMDREAYDAMIG